MRITIDVTKRDITIAKRDRDLGCPIECAVRRALGVRKNSVAGRNILMGYTEIYYLNDDIGDVRLAGLPQVAGDFLVDFDKDRAVEPFTFVADFNQRQATRVGLTLPAA